MTRQPSREKRLTVAWPMPRLAPVSTMVFLVSVSAMVKSPAGDVADGNLAAGRHWVLDRGGGAAVAGHVEAVGIDGFGRTDSTRWRRRCLGGRGCRWGS